MARIVEQWEKRLKESDFALEDLFDVKSDYFVEPPPIPYEFFDSYGSKKNAALAFSKFCDFLLAHLETKVSINDSLVFSKMSLKPMFLKKTSISW